MRILCVAEELPWPEVKGYGIRLSNVVRALAAAGDVDCFFVVHEPDPPGDWRVPDDFALARIEVFHEPEKVAPWARRARWMTSRLPVDMVWRDWSRARTALESFVQSEYDVVWLGHAYGYQSLVGIVRGPMIVDLDNLEDWRLRYQLGIAPDGASAPEPATSRRVRIRRSLRRRVDIADISRWDRLQHRIAREVAAVTVCSEIDRVRLGEPNCAVVPNGYDLPGLADGGPARTSSSVVARPQSSVITMVGDLFYFPNRDGARWFAERVLPEIRSALPEAEFRVVGRHPDGLRELDELPGVSLRGFVDDVSVELAMTGLEVVPLHSGGGTRIKILEAFAHRVPLVTTSVGCEGIDVDDGVHVLVADDAAAFAAACVRLLRDPALRERLADAAFELYWERFRWEKIRPSITALAGKVGGARG